MSPENAPPGDEVLIRAAPEPDRPGSSVVATFECVPKSGEWSATGTIARGPQGLVISGLALQTAVENVSGITGSLLRRIQVGDILHVARATIARASQDELQAPVEPEAATATKTRSGGRASLGDDLLRRVAVAYLAETAPGRPPGAVKRMAQEFHRPEETVRTWVARARQAGWLGPSVKGRAGAEPGPRLRDLTAEEFTRIYSEAYDSPPETLADLAAGFSSMPKARQEAASRAWFSQEKQQEINRATNEWEREQEQAGGDDE